MSKDKKKYKNYKSQCIGAIQRQVRCVNMVIRKSGFCIKGGKGAVGLYKSMIGSWGKRP